MTDEKREKAKRLRYKRAILRDLNLETIRTNLWDMSEACSDVRYFEGDEGLLNELIGDEDESFEFRMMFAELDNDVNHMLEDLQEEYVPDYFDDFFGTIGEAEDNGGFLGWDSVEQDYFGIDSYEASWAAEECGKRMMRLTKNQILEAAQICFRVAMNYIGLQNRYEQLKASIDILRGENAGFLQVIKSIDEAYKKAEKVRFASYEKATSEFDRLIKDLPDEVWIG